MQSGEHGLVEKEEFLYSIPSLQTVSAALGPASQWPPAEAPWALCVSWSLFLRHDLTLCLSSLSPYWGCNSIILPKMLPVYKLEEALAASVLGLGFIPHVLWRGAASKGDLSAVGHCEGSSAAFAPLQPQSCREVCSVKAAWGAVSQPLHIPVWASGPSCLLGLRCYWVSPGVCSMSGWGSCASKMLRELCRQQPVHMIPTAWRDQFECHSH